MVSRGVQDFLALDSRAFTASMSQKSLPTRGVLSLLESLCCWSLLNRRKRLRLLRSSNRRKAIVWRESFDNHLC